MNYQQELAHARATVETNRSSFSALPWNRGIWRQIFNPQESRLHQIASNLPPPVEIPQFDTGNSVDVPLTSPIEHARSTVPVWNFLFNKSDAVQNRMEGQRRLAISRLMLCLNHDSCNLFSQSSSLWDLHASFEACLSMKATATIVKRSLDLQRFFDWCSKNELPMLPLREETIWTFLTELQATAKPSTLTSIAQSISFVIHVLGVNKPEGAFPSSRIRGLCAGHKASAGPSVQPDALTVEQIKRLEQACCNQTDYYQSLVLGTILITLFARARWNDIRHADKIIVDPTLTSPQFLELPSKNFKTSSVLARKLHFLPITAVIHSFSGLNWFSRYVESREALGLTLTGTLTEPLLPTLQFGVVTTQPVPSSTITKFLRSFFQAPGLRCHSLKHTLLSFAAKRGLSPNVRKWLGYHLDRNEVTLATYSRDLLSDPLRRLQALLMEINRGTFVPDHIWSGYLIQQSHTVDSDFELVSGPSNPSESAHHVDIKDQHVNLIEEISDDDTLCLVSPAPPAGVDADVTNEDASSSSSSDSSSISSSDSAPDRLPEVAPHIAADCYAHVSTFYPVKHRSSHRLHLCPQPDAPRLVCGRAVSQTYERLPAFPSVPLPTCIQCFASKALESFEES